MRTVAQAREGLLWEDPPVLPARQVNRHPRGFWRDKLERLKTRPGIWARIADGLGQQHAIVLAHHLRTKRLLVPERGRFEIRPMTVGIEGRVYARFVPPRSSR